tara:strand:- start:9586 stop:10866 length:1281 start_codon:yes stop_codon:yes gene_type:complete
MTTKHLIDGRNPSKGSFYPNDVLELSEILREHHNEAPVMVPVGGGTRLQIGALMPRYDYALDLSKMNEIVTHNAEDLTCIVQPGITLERLQNVLKERGQFLAIDTPLPGTATVGGTLASNAPGYLRWQLAHMRDVVIGMQVVLPSGTITKSGGPVVKNVSGYDMGRLHIGGYGTLGVISEVSFKLTPLPRREGSVVVGCESMKEINEFSERIYDSYAMPLSLAGINSSMAKNLGVDLQGSKYLGIVRLGGRDKAYDRQITITKEIFDIIGLSFFEVIEGDSCRLLWESLRDFTGYDLPNAVSGRIFSTPTGLNNLAIELIKYFEDIDAEVSIVVQPGFGTMEFHFNRSTDLLYKEPFGMMDEINMIVKNNSSNINYEKLPSNLKREFNMWGHVNHGSQVIMTSLRDTYDPTKILNRGRYIADMGIS